MLIGKIESESAYSRRHRSTVAVDQRGNNYKRLRHVGQGARAKLRTCRPPLAPYFRLSFTISRNIAFCVGPADPRGTGWRLRTGCGCENTQNSVSCCRGLALRRIPRTAALFGRMRELIFCPFSTGRGRRGRPQTIPQFAQRPRFTVEIAVLPAPTPLAGALTDLNY